MARNDGATNGASTGPPGAVVTVSRGSVRLVSSGGAGKERRVEVGWDGLEGNEVVPKSWENHGKIMGIPPINGRSWNPCWLTIKKNDFAQGFEL